ncbi:MAG: hypothetical protein COA62_00065 [Rhodobiaceae bacterium]|nr:MAG: hypothetical protein COA62_00065 [Rhodobiaceae bacterium]
MQPCPECKSDNIFQYKKAFELPGAGGELLPKLGRNIFSLAKILPVVCGDCGFVRLFAAQGARDKLEASKAWERV